MDGHKRLGVYFLLITLLPGAVTSIARIHNPHHLKNHSQVAILNKSKRNAGNLPNFTYPTPNLYPANAPIPNLGPVNNGGGAVPATIFSSVSTFSGSGNPGAFNGSALSTSYYSPAGVAVDNNGYVYIADDLNHLIRKIAPDGSAATLAGSGQPGLLNAKGTAASFNDPTGIVVDGAGIVYVADKGNNVIRKITPDGTVSTFAGSGAAGNFDSAIGLAAKFNAPVAITIDAANNLYVTDLFNNSIRKISPSASVTTLAGNGTAGNINGAVTTASFNAPQGLTVDGAGNIYVADTGNGLIRKITPAGVVSKFAGNGNAQSVDGPVAIAGFNKPTGIAINAEGDIFVSDYASDDIRMINVSLVVSTPAGTGHPGSFNNTGNVASFYGPKGLAVAASSYLYIADSKNNEIRRMTITGYHIDKPLPPGLGFDSTTGIISGTPTAVSGPVIYYITGYNIYGSYTTSVSIQITNSPVIIFPQIPEKTVCDADFDPGATGPAPVTYTSSNAAVATITGGKVHIAGAGTAIITATDGITSSPQTLIVDAALVPSIAVSTGIDECQGVSITYTATYQNGGSNPLFQWRVNGQNSGPNSPVSTFSSSTLNNNDKVSCILTSNAACVIPVTATSNKAVVALLPPVITSVTISSSLSGTFCAGTEDIFTASAVTPDASPDYQWQINGNNTGPDNRIFKTSALADGDMVSCILTSHGNCLVNANVVSNSIPIALNPVSTCVINIPNAFTPNGDGINDLWDITALQGYPNCVINVYNRYGSLVYNSINYPKAWDGTYKSSALPTGTYYYIIDLKNGKKPLAGNLIIIR